MGSIINSLVPAELIPEKTTEVTPVAPLPDSIILKLLLGLLSVEGVWNTPLIIRIPFPPLVPIPIVFAPPTVKVNEVVIPLNSFDTSSNIRLLP